MPGPPQGQRSQQFSRPPQEVYTLPKDYLAKGYFDPDGNLWPEVVVDWPKDIAMKLRRAGMKSSQMRRFFNAGRALQARQKAGIFASGRVHEELRVLQTLAAASVGRKNAPALFLALIETNVQITASSPREDAFARGFMTHLQSIVAYLQFTEAV
jgi:CRISPR type III-A-associated protein Csm2